MRLRNMLKTWSVLWKYEPHHAYKNVCCRKQLERDRYL